MASERHQKKKHERARRLSMELVEKLYERFPQTFSRDPTKVRPLKIGINAEVVKAVEGEFSPYIVGKALRYYISSLRYQYNLAKGGERIDLEGHPCGQVTDEEKAYAKQKFRETQKAIKEKKKAQKKPVEAIKPREKPKEKKNRVARRPVLTLRRKNKESSGG